MRRRSRRGRPFNDEDTEIARAIAHLAAIAIKRAELIEGLTKANIVKDLFEALAAGATDVRRRQGRRGALRPDRAVPDRVRGAGGRARAGLGRVARRGRGARARPRGARAPHRDRSRPGSGAGGAGARHAAPAADRGAAASLPRARPHAAAPRSASASCTTPRPTRAAPTARRSTPRLIGRALLGDGRRDRLLAGRRLPVPRPHRRRGRAARPDASRGRPADRLRQQAAHGAARHPRALPRRAAERDRERSRAVHPPEHAAPAARADRGADRARSSTRTTCCRSSWRSSSRGSTGARVRASGASRSSTTRNTGTFARRRTRWGSCDQSKSPTTRLRSGSAAITIASQPASSASSKIRLVALRVPTTWPSASIPLRFSRLIALRDDLALLVPLASWSAAARASASRTRRRERARSRTRGRSRPSALGQLDARARSRRPGSAGPRRRAGSARTALGPAQLVCAPSAPPRSRSSDAPAIGQAPPSRSAAPSGARRLSSTYLRYQ